MLWKSETTTVYTINTQIGENVKKLVCLPKKCRLRILAGSIPGEESKPGLLSLRHHDTVDSDEHIRSYDLKT